MVKFRNRLTGSIMWVTDDRKDEYIAMGHTLADAPIPEKPVKEPVVEDKPKVAEKKAPAKKSTAKTTAKKK